MTDIAGLVERLEAATGQDEEIDCLIWQQINPDQRVMFHPGKAFGPGDKYPATFGRLADFPLDGWDDWHSMRLALGAPPLTGSIDAALSLVERKLGLDNETTFMYSFDFGWHASAHAPMAYTASLHLTVGTPPDMVTVDAQAPTLPLAVLIALLKALEQKATAP